MTQTLNRLKYHIDRAHKGEYDALTVETKVLENAYEFIRRQISNGYTEDKESEEYPKE